MFGDLRNSGSIPAPCTSGNSVPLARKGARYRYYLINFSLVAVLVGSVLWLLNISYPTARDDKVPLDEVRASEPPANRREMVVAADIQVVRAFRDMLVEEMRHCEPAPGIATRTAKCYAIEKMLTNSGKTGIADRLDEIQRSLAVRSSKHPTLSEEARIESAIRRLHQTAVSCERGALAHAVTQLRQKVPDQTER